MAQCRGTPMSTQTIYPIARIKPTAEMFSRTLAIVIGCVALFVVATVHSNGANNASHPTTVDELKRAYLLCNRTAMNGSMKHAAAMQCSILYEQLKERAFDGDFYKLLEWSRAQSPEHDTVDPSERTILDEQR